MKIARIIGLVAIAAGALMASVGVGSAFAAETTLCKTSSNSPYCANRYPAETAIEASASEVTIETSAGTITCGNSTLEGKTSAEAGEPMPISISVWSFKECKKGTKECTAMGRKLPYAGSLTRTKSWNGTLTLGNSGKGEPRLLAECIFSLHCEWAAPALTFEGGSPAHLAIPTTALEAKEGFFCPETATLKATSYTVNSPKPVYVATPEIDDPGTGLCSEKEKPCAEASLYPQGTNIEAQASNIKIEALSFTVTCKEASLGAETAARSDMPLPIKMTSFSTSGCSGFGSCTVATAANGLGTGALELEPFYGSYFAIWNLNLKFDLTCGGTYICTYGLQPGSFEGGNPAHVWWKNLRLFEEGGPLCGESYFTADFTISSPNSVFPVEVF